MKKYIIALAAIICGCPMLKAAQSPAPAGDDAVVITLKFSDGTNEIWPFKSPLRKEVGNSSDKTRNQYGQKFVDQTTDCVTKDGYTFKLFVSDMLVEHRYFGLRYDGVGDGFDFPVIPGKALTVISVTNGFKSASDIGCPQILTDDNSTVEGGEPLKKKLSSGETWSWVIKGKPGQVYRISQTTKREMDMRELQLVYTSNANKPIAVNVASGQVAFNPSGSVTLSSSFKGINGDATKFKAGFEYKKVGDEYWENKNAKIESDFSCSMEFKSLAKDSKYEYRPWVQAKGGSKTYGSVGSFFTGDMTLAIEFNNDPKGKNNVIYKLPASRTAATNFAGKVQKSNFSTDFEFEMWGESGVGKATNGGAVTGLVLNPMMAQATQYGQPFGKKGRAWIKLPAVGGRTLESIKLEFTRGSGMMNVSTTINKTSGEGSKDIADSFKLTSKNKVKTIETKDARKGTAYYICLEDAENVTISKMTLVYAL